MLWGSSAWAQPADAARTLFLDARFEEAITAFDDLLDTSDDAGDSLEAHRYLVVLHDIVGNADAAREHARAAIALDPSVELPEGSTPRAEGYLRNARAARERLRLEISVDPPPRSGDTATVRSQLRAGEWPRAQLRLECRFDARTETREGDAVGVELRSEVEAPMSCDAVLSAGDVVLVREHREFEVVVENQRSRLGWYIFGGVAGGVVVALVAGLVVGLTRSRTPQLGSFEPTFAD